MLTTLKMVFVEKYVVFFLLLITLVEIELTVLFCRNVLLEITLSSSFFSKNSIRLAMSMFLLL